MHKQFKRGWLSALNAIERLDKMGLDFSSSLAHCRQTIEELDDGDLEMVGAESDKATAYRFDGVVYELSDFGYIESYRTLEEIEEDLSYD